MKVALTGATGFIGSHILAELQAHGHKVTALVRDEARAETVAAVVDLYDRPAVVKALSDSDGAIHTATSGDATSADLDSAVVDAAIEAFDGTGKPCLSISGLWISVRTPRSAKTLRSTRLQWCRGRSRSCAESWMQAVCAAS